MWGFAVATLDESMGRCAKMGNLAAVIILRPVTVYNSLLKDICVTPNKQTRFLPRLSHYMDSCNAIGPTTRFVDGE